MIEIIRSIIIGAIQGVSEFLPVSSSGHLVVIPYIFHWNYQGLAFDVALHFGTVLALIAFFWKDWVSIIANAIMANPKSEIRMPSKIQNSNTQKNVILSDSEESRVAKSNLTIKQLNNYPKNLLWQIVIASIPAAVLGVFLNNYVETKFHSPLFIAFNLAFFGWLLWQIDKASKSDGHLSSIIYGRSFLIGLAQAVSLFPGVSRSGITITASRAMGLKREAAARFSFLLGTPAMFGAFIFKFKDIEKTDLNFSFWIGVASAAIFGFLAIKYLLEYLKKSDFSVFMWYRITLAITLLGLYFSR